MSLLGKIAATYGGPRPVLRGFLVQGPREDRALALAMGVCVLTFIAQWPRLLREAQASGADVQMLLGGALLGLVFIAPLLIYVLAGLSHLLMRVLGGQGSGYGARMALFWALAAAMPVMLVYGLVTGFMGAGMAKSVVGMAWCVIFLWFWIGGLIEAYFGPRQGSRAA